MGTEVEAHAMKIGIIVCDGNEKWISCIETICNSCFKRNGDADLQFYHAWKGQMPTLENTKHLDGLISLGSAHMVSRSDKCDWMVDLSNFFLALENAHVKLLAICFSHQLVNKAYGGEMGVSKSGFIFGVDDIKFRKSAVLPERVKSLIEKHQNCREQLEWNLLQSHKEEVSSLGEGAVLLASSKRCKNEIVLVRDNILSMQSHPDLTPKLMMDKIWPAIIRKGYVNSESEKEVRREMNDVDTARSLDFIRDFFRS